MDKEKKEETIFKKLRREKKLTLKQVAALAGLRYQQYQRIESGERSLESASFIVACKILEAFDLDITEYYHQIKEK